MRKKALPIGILVMVLVVLLAAVGISYGYWAETITAQADVTTGNLDVRWAPGVSSTSVSGSPGAGACSLAYGTDNNELIVTLSQIQPGFKCTFVAAIKNEGTVPVLVEVDEASISHDGGYAFTSDQFDMQITSCATGSPKTIQPGDVKTCSGYFELLYGTAIDNDTQDQWAQYTIEVDATQKP